MVDRETRSPSDRYTASITNWLEFGASHFHHPDGLDDIGLFGPTNAGALAIEATALYAFLHGLATRDGVLDLESCALDESSCTRHALSAFRYCLHTHRSHPRDVPEELAWGGTGMSPKMADQMALAAEVLDGTLTESERARFRELVEYEADCNILLPYHLEHVDHGYYRRRPPVPTERFGQSYPESNAWRANILGRAILNDPDHPHAGNWEESMLTHLANALSVPADADDHSQVGNHRLSDLHAGANLHPSFALEHHGFFHPGYVGRALLSLFSAAYAFDDAGVERPPLLLRNVPEVWDVQRRLLLWDGRLAYPAGNDYPRYVWGQLYMLPVLAFIRHEYDDPVAAWSEDRLTEILVREQQCNDDGSFCASRMEHWRECIERTNGQLPPQRPAPSVYYRSQVDTPYYIALALWWHRRNGADEELSSQDPEYDQAELQEPFCEPDCGLVFHRSSDRFASFSWNAYRSGAPGLVVPRGGDHMAEWQGNLISRFYVRGTECNRRVLEHEEYTYDGGAATIGTMATCDDRITHTVTFAALPDGRTTLYCSHARAISPVELLMHEGMCLNVANDVFNDNHQEVHWQDGHRDIQGVGAAPEDVRVNTPWLNIGGRLGVVELDDSERFSIRINGERRADGHSLCYDEIFHPHHELRRELSPTAVVEDAAVAFITSVGPDDTRRWPAWRIGPSRAANRTRVLTVRGMDDVWYLLAVSCNDEPMQVHFPLTMQAAGSRMLVGDPDAFSLVGDGAMLSIPGRGMLLIALAVDA